VKTREASIAISFVFGLGVAACQGKLHTGKSGPSDAGRGGGPGDLGTGGISTGGIVGSGGSSDSGTGGIIGGGSGGSATGGIGTGGISGSGGVAASGGSSAVTVVGVSVGVSGENAMTWAVLSDGSVRRWGNGQSPVPVVLSGISRAIAVSVGAWQACALMADGSVQCGGQSPAEVAGITSAVAVSAGGQHTCALLKDGTVQCWGQNNYGQLGNGTTSDGSSPSILPIAVVGVRGAVQVSAGDSHTCARLEDSSIQCWGQAPGLSPTPVDMGVSGVVDVSVGNLRSCAVFQDGSIATWGCLEEGFGPSYSCSERPGSGRESIPQAVAVSIGYLHRCALLVDHSIQCWGSLQDGRLGTLSGIPGPVDGITQAIAVAAGYDHSCALIADGSLECWGAGTATGGGASSVPVPVMGL
jgi:hypothetical protein